MKTNGESPVYRVAADVCFSTDKDGTIILDVHGGRFRTRVKAFISGAEVRGSVSDFVRAVNQIAELKAVFTLFALLVQYVADSAFLYAAKYDKYFTAGANDLLYLLAYAFMALALVHFAVIPTAEKSISQVTAEV